MTVVAEATVRAGAAAPASPPALEVVTVDQVKRSFGVVQALDGVSLAIAQGEIHALVGPNGAGKTTLLRVLTGLVEVDSGFVRIMGLDPSRSMRDVHRRLGVVVSGARSFYMRISGRENLVFFARLHGFSRREAVARADELLDAVDLGDAARRPVSGYSTGMQRRLAVARALLGEPALLLIDEATHDLDPQSAARVRALVKEAARNGAAVLWTTQRLEEIRGFADRVTLLDRGTVRFDGTLPHLLMHAARDQFLLRLSGLRVARAQLTGPDGTRLGALTPSDAGGDHYVLTLDPGAVLGDALEALGSMGARLLSCSEATPSVEEAYLTLIEGART